MSLDAIRSLLTQLPSHSLVHGGSCEGVLYQDYPWAPLDQLPAKRRSTAARLAWLLEKMGDVKRKGIIDIGCANGAIALGLMKAGAAVIGFDAEPVQLDIASEARSVLGNWWIPVRFGCRNIATEHIDWGGADFVLCLSVWKWIVRNNGMDAAKDVIRKLADMGDTLLFESGLTGTGIDLGVDVSRDEIESLLRQHFASVESLGSMPRDEMGVDREVWRCAHT